MRWLQVLFDLISIAGIFGFLAFFPITKLTIGGALAVLALFLPSDDDDSEESAALFRFCVRAGVIILGLFLLKAAITEGWERATAAPAFASVQAGEIAAPAPAAAPAPEPEIQREPEPEPISLPAAESQVDNSMASEQIIELPVPAENKDENN